MNQRFNFDLKRVLVIDGYGFRGLGSLFIIDRIVRSASIRAKKPLRPCDIFDLICGTSSGAIIAILLGRLGLDCATAISEFKELVKACYGENESMFWEHLLNDEKVDSTFDAALLKLVAKYSKGKDEFSPMLVSQYDTAPHTNTFVAVTSAAPNFTNRAHCIRSYNPGKGTVPPPPAHIWTIKEAARAASAAPFYTNPLLIDSKYGFRDSAFSGFNNPIKLSQHEHEILWPTERPKNILVVSLGTDLSWLVPQRIGRDWPTWAVTDGYCTAFANDMLEKLKDPLAVTDQQRQNAMHITRRVVYAAAETKGAHLEAALSLPDDCYCRIDPVLGLTTISFTDYYHEQIVLDAVSRWAENEGKQVISAIAMAAVEEKVAKVEDLRKLDPPRPPQGTVNDGYNPQLDKRRPDVVKDYLQNFRVLFLIDDSGSMKGSKWNEARDALSLIADHALTYKTRTVDMAFLNSEKVCIGVQGNSNILDIFNEVPPTGQSTPTGLVLQKHLRKHLDKLNSSIDTPHYAEIEPLDIIVLTDGCPSDQPEDVISDAVSEIRRQKHHPNCIGIQFVQIGNDSNAKDALQKLMFSEEVGMVDTVLFSGGLTPDKLERIILGGLHPNLRTLLPA